MFLLFLSFLFLPFLFSSSIISSRAAAVSRSWNEKGCPPREKPMGGVYRTSFIARARRINDSARERGREKGGNCEKVTKVRFYRSHGWLVLRMQERTLQVNKFRGFPRDRAVAVCAVPRCRQHPKQSARLASFTTTSRFLLKHTASISRYVANISSPQGNEGASSLNLFDDGGIWWFMFIVDALFGDVEERKTWRVGYIFDSERNSIVYILRFFINNFIKKEKGIVWWINVTIFISCSVHKYSCSKVSKNFMYV